MVKGKDGRVEVGIEGKNYTPEEISAMVLQKLKADAEKYLGETVTQAVITVPAYFNDMQRQATKDAGKIAGLEVLRIINEPTAAALAYGLDKAHKEQTVLVFDLGGGTFDVSVLELGDNVVEVRSTSATTTWAATTGTRRSSTGSPTSSRAITASIFATTRWPCSASRRRPRRPRWSCPALRTRRSTCRSSPRTRPVPSTSTTRSRAPSSRRSPPICSTAASKPVEQAMKDAGVSMGEIDEVILVGGSTRMPAVQELVKKMTGKDPHMGVNPDEVVALGAAIQGGVLSGEGESSILLLDVTPLSLGVETLGGVMTKLIERNTTIPTRKSEIFTTAADGQTSVEVHVLQGEREHGRRQQDARQFHLMNIPSAPRGVPQIEVAFDIDANGIVNVSAKDMGTGQEQKITITGTTALSDEEVDRMVKDADIACRRGPEAQGRGRGAQHRRQPRVCHGEDTQGSWRQGSRGDQERRARARWKS